MRAGARGSGCSWQASTADAAVFIVANDPAGCGCVVGSGVGFGTWVTCNAQPGEQSNSERRSAPVLPTTCHLLAHEVLSPYDQDTPCTHSCDIDASCAKRRVRGDIVCTIIR